MTAIPPSAVEAPADAASRAAGPLVRLVYAMSFASGAAALIYEVAWTKMLSLTFGSTTLAASAVVAAFLGGMGLGAWLYHLPAGRALRGGATPLGFYAALELGIAVTTALLSRTFYSLPAAFLRVAETVGDGPPLVAARFAMVFALLIVPAALMGATFPALCTATIRSVRGVDRHLGMIYGLNTVGAAAGALVAGLLLVERLGLLHAILVANALNLLIAVVAWNAARRAQPLDEPVAATDAAIPTALPAAWTAITLVLSGWATLSYEILWFRALRYLVGNSTYAFTVVLVVFLVGLGLGSILLRRVVRRGRPERDLALSQCAIAAWGLAAMAGLWLVTDPPAAIAPTLQPLCDALSIYSGRFHDYGWERQLALNGLVATVFLLPATLWMGLAFPLASRLLVGDVRRIGQRVGSAYLLANLGSIAGSIGAATLLLPLFGTITGTKLVAGINLAWGLVLWVAARRAAGGGGAALGPVAACAAAVALFAVLLPRQLNLHGERGAYARAKPIFTVEGDLATVQVLEDPVRPRAKAMAIDGAVIGCTSQFDQGLMAKQAVLAHLPMALDTRIRHTLNVGLGSGSTLAELARYPQLETLDCVEINAGVVAGARRYFPEGAVLDDPRVHVAVEDALYFLLRAPRHYDLIVSDGKQNPSFPGNAVMLCREFYAYGLDRLSDDGLFVQWLPLATLTSEFEIVLRTFCDVFPEADVFFFPDKSVLMVGARRPLAGRPMLDRETFDRVGAAQGLVAYGIDRPEALVAHWLVDKGAIRAGLPAGPLATWDHNPLEFTTFKAPRAQLDASPIDNLLMLHQLARHVESRPLLALIDPHIATATQAVQDVYLLLTRRELEPARLAAERAVEAAPDYLAALATRDLVRQVFAAQNMRWPGS
ncbi:MAG: fused MFS/spermidine synthase [Pirellulales bacterium]|nr:fused MFS/spermidine synthase [Pirellulales bacterium]